MSCQRQCPIYSYHSLRSYRKTQKCALSTCGAECNRVAHLKTIMICGCCSLPSLLVSVYSENEYDIIRLVWESRWRQPRCRRWPLVYVFIVPPFVWHVLAGCSWLMHVHDSALLFVIYLHGAAVEFVYIWSGPAVEAFFMSLFTVGWDLPVLFSLFAHISEERRNTVAIPCERKSSNKWISMWEKEKQKHMYISKLPVTSVIWWLLLHALFGACIISKFSFHVEMAVVRFELVHFVHIKLNTFGCASVRASSCVRMVETRVECKQLSVAKPAMPVSCLIDEIEWLW